LSLDISLVADSEDTAGSDWFVGCGIERPTWVLRGDRRGHYSCLCHPARGKPDVPAAGGGLFVCGFHVWTGSGADPDPVAGRRLAGSEESPEQTSSVASACL
jgi:hypothetical protein